MRCRGCRNAVGKSDGKKEHLCNACYVRSLRDKKIHKKEVKLYDI